MLQTIREHTQGWFAGTIISVIILSFALWGIHSYVGGASNNTNVAEVNGVDITKEQLAVAYERLRRQVQIQYGANNPITSKDESALKNRAMQTLIDIEVLKQASTAQGFRVSDRQIDNYLRSMPEFQVDGQFSFDKFQEILSSTLLSTSEFLDLIRTSLLIDQPKMGLVFTSFALPDETKNTIELVNQERDLDYMTIPMQGFTSKPITISQDKIQAYYDQNKADFMTPEQANVEYIQLSLKDLADKINPTEAMLKSFYNENINSYTQPTQWKYTTVEFPLLPTATPEEATAIAHKATEAANAIKSGADIAKVAAQYAGNMNAENWTALAQVPAELQKAVSGLSKPGDTSDPFKTAKGWMIVKAVDVQEPKMLSFEAVQSKVKDAYVHQHAEEKFAEMRDQLADLTYEHPESLQLAAKTLNLPVQTSELFTKEKPGKDISQYKKVREMAFSNDVINLQNNSDVILVNPETALVIRIKSHVASALLPLSEISKQIEEKLKAKEVEALAAQYANDLQKQLESGTDPEKLAAERSLKWVKTGYIGRYSTKVDNAVLDLAFRLPIKADNKIAYGVTRLPNAYAIVAMKSVKAGTIADKKQLSVYSEQLQNSDGMLEYQLYKQSVTDAAKIKVQS